MSLIIKMDSIKEEKHLNHAVKYILNEAKTEGLYHSNSGFTADEILDTFKFTRDMNRSHGKRLGYHYKFSFSKDETLSSEKALSFIRDWVEKYLGDDYDFVCSVHSDRDHLHMHLIFNSYCRLGGKYRYEKGDWEKIIKPLTNEIAKKYGTGHLKEKDEALDYDMSKEKKVIWADVVRKDIDACIADCRGEIGTAGKKSEMDAYELFKTLLVKKYGYELREGVSREYGVYLALTPPGRAKAVRSYHLRDGYMPVDIEKRILGKELQEKRFNLDQDKEYRKIYVTREIWFVGRPVTFIPYKELSMYQKYFVRRMLEARRLYKATGSSLQMREQAERSIRGMTEDATFICRYNIRSERELHRMIEDLSEEHRKVERKSSESKNQKYESKRKIIRKLRELENPRYQRRAKHK